MPTVEFTFSERRWYAREAQIAADAVVAARAAVPKAEEAAKVVVGRTLAEICQSHEAVVPPNAELVKDRGGAIIGLIWGKDYKEWLDGKLKIEGSVVPVMPKPPERTADKKMLEETSKRLAERMPKPPEKTEKLEKPPSKPEVSPIDVNFRAEEAPIVAGVTAEPPANGTTPTE